MKKEKRRMKKSTKEIYYFHIPRIFLILLFSLFSFLFSLLLYADEGRPLRSVQPKNEKPDTCYLLPATLLKTHPQSLLTETALEQPLTQHHIAQYTSNSGIAILNAILDRANIYLPFIIQEVERRGLPPELAYLPVIESGFQVTARSKSGAMGLWQFMMNSISPFDMKVNDHLDERRDFIKSTMGALQKLEDNYKALGSWELALAAYNAGLGAVTRIVNRTGIRDYWELSQKKHFRQETENFVPKLIAAVYVISNPRRYGINAWHIPFKWEAVPLMRQVSLEVIAEETGISIDLLRRLNAQWLHGISPSNTITRLVVPSDKFEEVSELLERDDIRFIKYFYHTVKQGDTLWGMSRHYGTPLDMIEQHNPGVGNRYLKLGETIIIPIIK